MSEIAETIDGLPNLAGAEGLIERTFAAAGAQPVYLADSRIDFDRIRSACAVALHMHQSLTPAGGDDLHPAKLIGNRQYMTEHPGTGDKHNAPVFRHCYARMGEIVSALLAEGREPRVADQRNPLSQRIAAPCPRRPVAIDTGGGDCGQTTGVQSAGGRWKS